MFIVFEGVDGAGTTTQATRLVNYLKEHHIFASYSAEPTDASVGALLRDLLHPPAPADPPDSKLLALLFAADRLQHVASVIEPVVRNQGVAVTDRYLFSSLVYQGTDPQTLEWVEILNRYAPPPDITFLLEVDADTAMARIFSRQASASVFDSQSLLETHIHRYNEVASRYRESMNVVRIDGSAPVSDVFACVLAHVSAHTPGLLSRS